MQGVKAQSAPGYTPARLRWLTAEMRRVAIDIKDARESKSWSAVASLRSRRAQLRNAFDLASQERDAILAESTEGEVTPEQRIAALQDGVLTASDEELELFVEEWLRRRKYALVVDDDGVLRVERMGLRLVR